MGILLAAFDPVAADSTATTILNDVRRENGLRPITESGRCLTHVRDAQRLGLGVADWTAIDLVNTRP